MRTRCFTLGILLVAMAGFASLAFGQLGGPVLIGGDDADDHGTFNGTNNVAGWLYIEDGFNVMGPCVDNNQTRAVCIGCNGGAASGGFNSGFDQSDLPGLGWTRVSLVAGADITNFFNGTGAVNINNTGIIYMPTDGGNVSGGINAAQVAIVNANAAILNNFVSNGGGLFTHDQRFVIGGYGWLTALLPGIVVHSDAGCNFSTLNLTADGQAAFPQLTDPIISNATPWHSWFSGNFGGLEILVTGPCGGSNNPVILGGCEVVIQQSIRLDPRLDLNPPGTQHTVTATVTDNLGNPVVGTTVTFNVISGPNTGTNGASATNGSGEATFTYTGLGGIGVDVIEASFVDGEGATQRAQAQKFWDNDCNENGTPDQCDISCDNFGGACRTKSEGFPVACGGSQDVDNNGVPDECNRAPDCTQATASPAVLWPPNHKYRAIGVVGVTDPDGDPVVVTVTGITQDEPLNTRGDGNTCPDGQIADGQASVRAERTGTPGIPGNGRVYTIHFTADDGQGGTCEGSVTVCVPHDMGDPTCIDDGQRYNSLGPCTSGDVLAPEALSLRVGEVTSSQARVTFALPAESMVDLSVFDVTGRRLATLENARMSIGVHERSWSFDGVPNGLYFVRLRAGDVTVSRVVIKAQ